MNAAATRITIRAMIVTEVAMMMVWVVADESAREGILFLEPP